MTDIRILLVAAVLAAPMPWFVPLATAQDDVALDATVVTATRQRQRAEDSLASIDVLERDDIERAGHSSLIEVLQAHPGIQVTANGGAGANASVFIRGSEARHTLLLIDGMRVGSATSGAPALESVPLGMIERIEIVRGPSSALYGSEAIGGVIQIFTRRGEAGFHPEVFVGYGSQDTFKGRVSVGGGVERLRFNLNAGKQETDGFNAKRDPAYWARPTKANPQRSSYWADRDGFHSEYFNGSLTLGFRERDEAGVSFFQSDGRNAYDVLANAYFDSYIDKKSSTTAAHVKNAITADWVSTLRVGQSEEETLNKASIVPPTRFETVQDQLVWQHDISLPIGSLLVAYERVESKVDSTTAYRETSRRVNSALLGWSARVDAHHFQFNARHDDNSQFGGKTTGMLAYGYDVSREIRVRGSIATAFNAPTFNQLYWPGTTGYFGNPDLVPEEALNREIGVRWASAGHGVELSYFNNRVRDLIMGTTTQPRNVSEASLEGVELAYQTSLVGVDLSAGFDFLDARDEHSDTRLARRAARGGFLRIGRNMNALNWGVELNGAGRRYEDSANTVELHGYALLNAYARYRLASAWQVEMRANNILDKEYELARGYRSPGASVFVGVRYAPR